MNKLNMFLLKAQDVVPKSLDGTEMFPIKREKLVPENWPQSSTVGVCFSAPAGPQRSA